MPSLLRLPVEQISPAKLAAPFMWALSCDAVFVRTRLCRRCSGECLFRLFPNNTTSRSGPAFQEFLHLILGCEAHPCPTVYGRASRVPLPWMSVYWPCLWPELFTAPFHDFAPSIRVMRPYIGVNHPRRISPDLFHQRFTFWIIVIKRQRPSIEVCSSVHQANACNLLYQANRSACPCGIAVTLLCGPQFTILLAV